MDSFPAGKPIIGIIFLQWITFGDYTEAISKIKESGIPIMVMVQSVEEAVKAAARGASAIVAQVICSMCRHPVLLRPYYRQALSLPASSLPLSSMPALHPLVLAHSLSSCCCSA